MEQPELLLLSLRKYASKQGIDQLGIAPPVVSPLFLDNHLDWLSKHEHADIEFLERRPADRYDARRLLPGCESVIVVGLSYYSPLNSWPEPNIAKVARFSWGDDYHDVVRRKLETIGGWLDKRVPEHRWKATVDVSPIAEKAFAVSAGIGWQGRNTLVITDSLGSYFVIGLVLTTAKLPRDKPLSTSCGDCRKCIDACPTGALQAPGFIDIAKCISYQNSLAKSTPPLAFQYHGWLFGCDDCQRACPHNEGLAATREPGFVPRPWIPRLTPERLLTLAEEQFKRDARGNELAWWGLDRLKNTAKRLIAEQEHSI